MRSVRVLRNVVTNYLRFFLAGLIGFLITPVLVHVLGDGDYGLWVTVFSLTGYFGLFDQGIRPSLVRYVSRDHARGDREGVARTLSSAVLLYGALGAVTLVVTVLAATAFTRFLRIEPAQVDVARQVILIAGLSVALGFPLGVFGAALSGLQRYDLANLVGIGVGVARALAFVTVLRLGGGLVGLAWASLGMNLAGHALSWLLVRRLLPDVRLGLAGITRERLGLIGAYSGFAFVGAIANSITFQTDALVITGFLGVALVTPFALAAGLVDNARSLVYSATWVLAPTASELETLGETRKLHAMVIAGAKYSVLVSWPVLFALMVYGPELFEAWVGHRFRAEPLLRTLLDPTRWQHSTSAAPLLFWLALPTLVSLPQSAAGSVLYGVSRHRGVVALALLNAALNLGLSILWVRPYGLAGVALGTAVPLVLVGGVATMLYTCRALRLPLARYAWQGFVRPGFVTLGFLVPALALRLLWHPTGWWELGTAVAGSWLFFMILTWRFGLDATERGRWGSMVPGLFGRPAAGGLPAPVAPAAGPADARCAGASPGDRPDGARGAARPRVSVVVPAYNAAWCIEWALEDALAQTRPPHEIIVADDGSSDGTAELVERRFGAAVTVLRLPHSNSAAARRSAIERSSGDWIAFLDADDRWRPGKLERQLDFLERHPEVRWLTGNGRLVSNDGVVRDSWLSDYFDPVRDATGDMAVVLAERCFPLTSATLVERAAYEAVGGIDPEMVYAHDYDLWLRLAVRYPGGLMAEPLVDYYSGPGTLSRDFEPRTRDDLALMRRMERGDLGGGARLRRVGGERAAALEFDVAILCAKAGRLQEARERLRRVLGRGPWNRRLVALSGVVLPIEVVDWLMRSGWTARTVQGARRVAGKLPLPDPGERPA